MNRKINVGDSVRVGCYENEDVTGKVTSITQERTLDWKYYTAYHVEYDTPVQKEFRNNHMNIVRGLHTERELSRIN